MKMFLLSYPFIIEHRRAARLLGFSQSRIGILVVRLIVVSLVNTDFTSIQVDGILYEFITK